MVMRRTVIYKLVERFGIFLKTETVAVGRDGVRINLERVWDNFPVGVVEETVLFALGIDHVLCMLNWLFVTNEVVFTCARVFFLQPFDGMTCGR